MRKISVGVVGLGLGYHHAAAYARSEAVDRLVLCDTSLQTLERVQTEIPKAAAVYQDMDDMLGSEHLDAVSIVTPDNFHRQQAEAAFAAGCHVLLTKPLATNLDDARSIVRKSEAAGVKFMVAQERRFRSDVLRIKKILDSGVLGEIIYLRIDAYQDARGKFNRAPWYASKEAGRTAISGSGIHQVDLVRYLSNKRVESVFAYGNQLGTTSFPGNRTLAALFKLEGDVAAQTTITYEATSGLSGDDFRLVATNGMIVNGRVKQKDTGRCEELPEDQDPIVAGTYGCVSNFLQAVVENRSVAISGRDAFESLAVCIAADESSVTALPVEPARADFR